MSNIEELQKDLSPSDLQMTQTIDVLLERGLWQRAFLLASKNLDDSLKEMHGFLIKHYDIYEYYRDEDPNIDDTAGLWYDAFVNSSTGKFLPSINNLLKVFGKAINEIDSVNPVVNYDVELEELRDTIDTILQEES
ncbi:MAG: hypothetical protein IJP44_15295 [Bacteroidales bacterium]|nr:hypothetical protein [Bacteroidales bacterium]